MKAIELDDQLIEDSLKQQAAHCSSQAKVALDQLVNKQCVGAEWTGWFDWPEHSGFKLATHIKSFQEQELRVPYDVIVVIGIGGSYLGTRAVAEALSHTYQLALPHTAGGGNDRRKPIIYAGHHLSESGIIELLDFLETKMPLINVISKSGTTTEPGVVFRILRQYLEARFGKEEARQRVIATTDQSKGALRKLALEEKYKTFVVPDDVGGRYSVLTAVGLVPLALAGFNIDELLSGASRLFSELKHPTVSADHPVLKYAALRYAALASGKDIEILSYYEPKLGSLVEWWKQLFGESEGKEHKGLFPAGLAYTTDLHSLGQYVQEGQRNIFETFLSFRSYGNSSQVERRLRVPHEPHASDDLGYLEGAYIQDINLAAFKGSQLAHFDGGVPCIEIKVERLDEYGVGELFAFFETACAVSAAMLGVNPFDQPGVEAYKKNLFGLMGKPGFEELGQRLRKRI